MNLPSTATRWTGAAMLVALTLVARPAECQTSAAGPPLLRSAPATQAPGAMARGDRAEWKVGVYPIYVWLPFGIGMDVTVPPDDNGSGGRAEILDSRFDGAYFGGFYASKDRFRIDADGLWAAFGGDRPDLPFLQVDVDAMYFHTTAGVRLGGDLYAVGGLRRIALKYEISIANRAPFERKPSVWDPVVGLAWHTEGGRVLEFHAVFEGGGFGVGTEKELAASARLDIKPFKHVGITAGYAALHFELEDDEGIRRFTAKQTLHGPIVGLALYF